MVRGFVPRISLILTGLSDLLKVERSTRVKAESDEPKCIQCFSLFFFLIFSFKLMYLFRLKKILVKKNI